MPTLPLSTQTFYRLADQTPAAANIQSVLDAIFTALGLTTDYRGTSLPSTHQWTSVSRYQLAGVTQAVYCSVPSGSPMTVAPKIIFAGAAAGTPTMASPDTFLGSTVMVGINKNAGAFNAWDAAAPFTSGAFSGYWRAAGTALNSASATIRVYVSQEMIVIDGFNSATSHWPLIVGAWVEPYTDDQVNCSDSDGRLYGMMTAGSAAALSNTFLSSGTTFLNHSTSSGNAHCCVFQPTTGSLYNCGAEVTMQAVANLTDQDMASSDIGCPIPVARSTAATTQNGKRLGRAREIYMLGAVQGGRTRRNGSTDLFHVIGYDSSAADDAICIKAAS